ncbi:MAG: hypothetical protein EAZ85_14670 [Bacteroidetes bacterium]|nr:MAG: hypothetical protein EAZ85_14670 [Bacteroidota bacterium]TAG86170.1 MAG: hypothetical protein EAZ20_13340 [Bacteroidota bacterium]
MNNPIYEKSKVQFLSHFPSILPMDQAYVHVGMFLGWMLEHDLYSDIFEDEEAHQLLRFKNREISCSLLSALWDGYLGEELFNEEGNEFCHYYYQSGIYRRDYQETLVAQNQNGHVEDTWDNYTLLAARITHRFKEWKKNLKPISA